MPTAIGSLNQTIGDDLNSIIIPQADAGAACVIEGPHWADTLPLLLRSPWFSSPAPRGAGLFFDPDARQGLRSGQLTGHRVAHRADSCPPLGLQRRPRLRAHVGAPPSIAPSSTWATLYLRPSSAAFITTIAESSFTQVSFGQSPRGARDLPGADSLRPQVSRA